METEDILVKLGQNLEINALFKLLGSGCGRRG